MSLYLYLMFFSKTSIFALSLEDSRFQRPCTQNTKTTYMQGPGPTSLWPSNVGNLGVGIVDAKACGLISFWTARSPDKDIAFISPKSQVGIQGLPQQSEIGIAHPWIRPQDLTDKNPT
ncbi:hypothetical protein HanPI659440_Chr15g0586651 [Helianthus annuus]|nr:hypothetical protein HanPI659440_Chr15g0586651 [Helianthus annuus]